MRRCPDTMEQEDELRRILGKLSGRRLEDVADSLIALFREPEWWEAEFDAQLVARGSIGALQDGETRDAVKAFIRALLTRVKHEERQQCLLDIERIRDTCMAGEQSPEEQMIAMKLYACLLHALRQHGRTPHVKPQSA
jgi:hypothetical protein